MSKLLQSLKVSPENHGLVETLYFALLTSGIASVMLGAMLPYIRDESSLSYAQSGLMLSAHQLGNFCAVLVAGVLPYLIGQKKSTLIMGAGIAAGLILMTLTNNPWVLFAAFAFTGVGRGTMSNICNTVISEVSGSKSAAINVLHAAFAVGALLSPAIVYACTRSSDSGWKLAAATAAAISVIAWVLIACSKLPDKASKKESGGTFSFLKDVSFWLNTMILFFYLCAEASIMGWFVMYFEDMGIFSPDMAKFTPTMLWIMIMTGRLSCAAISSRMDKNKLLLVLSISFAFCFTGMLLSKSAVFCIIFLLGVGFSMAGIYPTTFSTMQGTPSTMATGFLIAIASLGGILMPGIVGAVADVHGLAGGVAMVLTALAGMVILITVKLVIAKKDGKAYLNNQ